jgi:hypothetical protein
MQKIIQQMELIVRRYTLHLLLPHLLDHHIMLTLEIVHRLLHRVLVPHLFRQVMQKMEIILLCTRNLLVSHLIFR